jgi:phosphate/sulfate permease
MSGVEQLSAFTVLNGGGVNVLLMLCFATLLAWSNGANDIANSVGTVRRASLLTPARACASLPRLTWLRLVCVQSVGAGAISLRVALVIGSVSEFLGCLLMGGEVAKTVGKGVVNLEEWDEHSDLLAIAMTAVLAGAGISTASATAFGLPVSATHGAISGLTAVALFERGAAAVNGSGLAFTVVGWVASPLVGGLVAGSISALIERKIFCAANPAAEAHKMRPTLVAGTLGLVVVFLCSKGPKWMRLPWWGDCIALVVTVGGSSEAKPRPHLPVPFLAFSIDYSLILSPDLLVAIR